LHYESEIVKGFWREEAVCFSIAEIVLPANQSFFFEASPPVSPISLGNFHRKENLGTPSSASTTLSGTAIGVP
jgi:hypothetical protein